MIRTTRRALIAGAALTTVAATGAALVPTATAAQQSTTTPLPRPEGRIKVAFLLDLNATMIDFAGPWEAFQDVMVGDDMPFELFTVAPTTEPIRATGGMEIIPAYDLRTAPQPNVVVIPAQSDGPIGGPSTRDAKVEWIRQVYEQADVVMSVCTGAFLLAHTGLLDGKTSTTHHEFYNLFERQFPNVTLIRGRRFVDNGKLISAGGLTSGVDGALHVVSRYFGDDVAAAAALYMEHDGEGWRTGVRG